MSSKKQTLIDRLTYLGQMGSTETALFHQKAAESYGLGITDMKSISVLMQEGSMTAGQLGERLHITSGAVTSLVDRLEKHGMLRRIADPKDRRKVIVAMVAGSIDRDDKIYASMGAAYIELVNTFTENELEFLVRYHEKQIEITKEQIQKLAKTSGRNK